MPLLSIVDATVEAILGAGLRSVGLLGSLFTMRERFFLDVMERAASRHSSRSLANNSGSTK